VLFSVVTVFSNPFSLVTKSIASSFTFYKNTRYRETRLPIVLATLRKLTRPYLRPPTRPTNNSRLLERVPMLFNLEQADINILAAELELEE